MRWNVYVVDSKGSPVRGKRVTVMFTSVWRGSLEEYTNDDGHAIFDYDVDEGEANIVMNNEKFGTHYIEDGRAYTVEFY